MLQFARCGLIILICLPELSTAERHLDPVTRSRPPATHTVPHSQINTQSLCRHTKDELIQKRAYFSLPPVSENSNKDKLRIPKPHKRVIILLFWERERNKVIFFLFCYRNYEDRSK
ncbi:hypothetical protein AMECASPLE_021493 [Ameca splendens]|uniref:Secreted protein n=1 Tax=Ameca splendens TaxID=208324 RepID=A0ABV0Z2H6_9TELE